MARTKQTSRKSRETGAIVVTYTDMQCINSLAAFRHFHSRNDLELSHVENSALGIEGWALYFGRIASDNVILSSLFQRLDTESFNSIIDKLT